MDRNSIADMEIEGFNNNIEHFVRISKSFSNKNVKISDYIADSETKNFLDTQFSGKYENTTDYLQVNLSMDIPREICMALTHIVHGFVVICETHDFNNLFTDTENGFLSGMKCVDNILKHGKKHFNITDLIYPDFNVELLSDNLNFHEGGSISIPLDQIEFRLGAIWVKITEEIISKIEIRNKKHFENYSNYIEGFDVIDTVITAKKIIDTYNVKRLGLS